METGNYDYEVGDTVYLHHTVVTKKGTCGRRWACPAKYLGKFKDRFGMTGTIYCFKPVRGVKPYVSVQFKPEEVNGEIVSCVIPFAIKPCCYGKVKH